MKNDNRYFVAIGKDGTPVTQRVTVQKDKLYQSASLHGDSFSSSAPTPKYPLRVMQVQAPVEWIARATLPDGTTVTKRSKASPFGKNFLRYSYANGKGGRAVDECFTNDTEEETREEFRDRALAHEIVAFVPAQMELRNWPVK